jgi:hypothetical protein
LGDEKGTTVTSNADLKNNVGHEQDPSHGFEGKLKSQMNL